MSPNEESNPGNWESTEGLPGPDGPCVLCLRKETSKKLLKTPPFPSRYPETIRQDAMLQGALDRALANRFRPAPAAGPAPNWVVPVAIASLTFRHLDGTCPFAHHRGDEVHYSASLVKVAAMYAAYELRNTLRKIAKELGADAESRSFLRTASQYLDPHIMSQVNVMSRSIPSLRGIPREYALPRYASTFRVTQTPSGVGVEFTRIFDRHLHQMISVSNNSSAGAVVHGVGYGYLNGSLVTAGFLDLATRTGLFLGGDYSGGKFWTSTMTALNSQRDSSPSAPSTQSRATAQAATARQLVRLYVLLSDGKLVDEPSSEEMRTLLAEAVAAQEVYIGRGLNYPSDFSFLVTHNKLGRGVAGNWPLSEASLLVHASAENFAIAWQNYEWEASTEFRPITGVIDQTLKAYLRSKQP